jgi:two-component system sensor histidine kinase RegB
VPDLALQQAVINLLSNAASVSPHFVALAVHWTPTELTIRVTDRGPGLAPEVADKLGNEFVSTKATGCGLGLFLTRVTAQRLGGHFDIRNAAEGGVLAEIVVPLAALRTMRT